MYPTAALIAMLLLAPVALAEEGGAAVPIPPSLRGSIGVSKALTPAQKVATLEETLNTETDRRVELEGKLDTLSQENTRLASTHEALVRDKAAADGELARTREALTRAQRDFEALRAGYVVITRIIGLSFPVIAVLVLFVFALLGWLIFITRGLAARVHDVPTITQIREYDGQIGHLHELLNVEKTHVKMLKDRLSKLGIAE
jgi:hypothetical protein